MKEISLTDEQKEKIVEELNSGEDDSLESNTKMTSIADDPEAKALHDKIDPKKLYENQIAANFKSIYELNQLLPKISKKNLIKLMTFICRLPEKDSYIKFGGTKEQQQFSEMAFIKAQIASNAKTYIMSVDAKARAILEKKKQEEEGANNG